MVKKTHIISAIIGIGNPDYQYAKTRHNIGKEFIYRVAEEYQSPLREIAKLNIQVARIKINNNNVLIAVSNNYMNHSGQAVQAVCSYYKIDPLQLLIAHDELDLAVGAVRFKTGGGLGGHNGLRDIAQKIGSQDFNRLRFGIGRPVNKTQVTSYVLQRSPKEEEEKHHIAMNEVLSVMYLLIDGEFDKAMTNIHSKR